MKKFVLILVCLFSIFVIAGCGPEKEIDLVFEVLSPDDIKNETVNITFRVRSGVVANALNDTLIPEFQKQYPNIKVNIDALQGDYTDVKNTTLSDLNNKSDNVPDMVIGYPDHFAEYFAGGNLINLQKFIDDETVGYSEEELNDFVESYLEENQNYDSTNPDDFYGLPFNKSTEVMIYNKTFFKGLFGEEEYVNKIPKTWQEVEALSKEILQAVKDGEADKIFVSSEKTDDQGNIVKEYLKISEYGDKFIPFGYDSSDNAFITMTRQFGGAYTQKISIVKGKVLYNNEENIQGLTYFSDLKDQGLYAVAGNWGEKYCSNLFKKIQCVMTVGSSAGVNYNSSENYEYELGLAEIPYYYNEDLGEEQNKYVIQQGTNICILNQNTNKQRLACWLFTKFLLEPENSAKFAMETGGYLPVRKSSYETEDYELYLTTPTTDKVSYSAAANVALNYINNGYKFFVDPAFVGSTTVRNTVGSVFTAIITNKSAMTSDQIKQALVDSYNQLGPNYTK